jgi:hypothetical protein
MLYFDFICYFYRIYKIYLYNKQVFVAWLVGDYLLLRDFGPNGIILYNYVIIHPWPTMGAPREVARDGYAGREELYATLYPKNISPLTCTIKEWNQS